VLFNKFSYSKTSADEIARSLGISKRTLYEQYMKKAHIATTLLIQTAREVDRLCDPLSFADQDTYHHDLHTLLTTYVGMLREVTPTFTDDLAAVLPRQHAAFMTWRRTSFEYHVSRAYAEGKRLGTIRASTDASTLIALLRLALENVLLQPAAKRLAGSTAVADNAVFTILYDGILQRREQSPQQPTH
jgi:AcrR family transcriptional regulator